MRNHTNLDKNNWKKQLGEQLVIYKIRVREQVDESMSAIAEPSSVSKVVSRSDARSLMCAAFRGSKPGLWALVSSWLGVFHNNNFITVNGHNTYRTWALSKKTMLSYKKCSNIMHNHKSMKYATTAIRLHIKMVVSPVYTARSHTNPLYTTS